MFTGIVEHVNRVVRAGNPLQVENPFDDLELGESIAINGCCLTLVSLDPNVMEFNLTNETLTRTTLGSLTDGEFVNVERAIRFGDRLGGHIVQGHVDGIATITSIQEEEPGWQINLEVDRPEYLADKGSITLDGISLTIVQPIGREFQVAIAPYTWEHTTLRHRKSGDKMNVEYDVLAKHVARLLEFKT